MILDFNENKPVAALLGAGAMGLAIVRRIAAGATVLLGDVSEQNLDRAAQSLRYNGYDVQTMVVNALNKDEIYAFAAKASELGDVMWFIDTAGASPSQAKPQFIIDLDLIGTSYALDAFGPIMARGGAGLIVSSQAGHMGHFTEEEEDLLALTPTDELQDLPMLQPDVVTSSGKAYIVAKRANHLRVRTAAATSWADSHARINSISPGIVMTPVAYDEFNSPGNTYQHMIEAGACQRVTTPDEIASASAFLLGNEAAFITGTDLLIDGGTIAAMRSGSYEGRRDRR